MLRNIIDLCILVAILYFGFLVFREQAAIVPLDKDIQRISAFLGELPIADPKKAYIKALPCDRPFEYMWRVYLPADKGLSRKISYDGGGSTSGPSTPQPNHSRDYVMKARIGFDSEYGSVRISEGEEFSSGFTTTSKTLAKLLADPALASIHQAALNEVVELSDHDKHRLFTISIPSSESPALQEIVSFDISLGSMDEPAVEP